MKKNYAISDQFSGTRKGVLEQDRYETEVLAVITEHLTRQKTMMMMRIKKIFSLTSLLMMLTFILNAQTSPVLLLAYEDFSGNGTGLTYWKNGKTIPLTDGKTEAGACAITVSGNDEYVAGYEYTPEGEPVATYWKNGKAIRLTDGKTYAKAISICVSGSDVHVIGNNGQQAIYWKNGVATAMEEGTKLSAITVAGADVYMAGYQINEAGMYVATYWKNGKAVPLTDGERSAEANAIAVTGNDVHVAGFAISDAGNEVAMYWKNNQPVILPKGCGAKAITVSGNDVYVAGFDRNAAGTNNPVYWKNGKAEVLDAGKDGAGVNAIAVAGPDVYIAGYLDGIATYWKNGKAVSLNNMPGKITGLVAK